MREIHVAVFHSSQDQSREIKQQHFLTSDSQRIGTCRSKWSQRWTRGKTQWWWQRQGGASTPRLANYCKHHSTISTPPSSCCPACFYEIWQHHSLFHCYLWLLSLSHFPSVVEEGKSLMELSAWFCISSFLRLELFKKKGHQYTCLTKLIFWIFCALSEHCKWRLFFYVFP